MKERSRHILHIFHGNGKNSHATAWLAIHGEEGQIEASFQEVIGTAREQKSVSLEKRAEATYAEYRSRKRAGREAEDSDYPFTNFSQRSLQPPGSSDNL